jgi:hypothetical protein
MDRNWQRRFYAGHWGCSRAGWKDLHMDCQRDGSQEIHNGIKGRLNLHGVNPAGVVGHVENDRSTQLRLPGIGTKRVPAEGTLISSPNSSIGLPESRYSRSTPPAAYGKIFISSVMQRSQLRISAIVDACFRLIVDGRFSAIVDTREVRASERVNVSQSSTISLKRTVAKRFLEV